MINSVNNSSIIGNYNTDIKSKVDAANSGSFEQMLQNAVNSGDEKKLKQACQSFESIFVNMMFSQMKQTVQKADLFDDTFAEDTFDEMLTEKYADEISKNKGIGLGDMIYKQLSRNISKQ